MMNMLRNRILRISVGCCLALVLILSLQVSLLAQQRVPENSLCLVYYLPESPVPNPFDIFDNLDALSSIIRSALTEKRPIEKFIFKKREDFERFQPQNRIDFLIVDPLYASQMQDTAPLVPICIMKIDGAITHSKDLAVLDDSPLRNLKDCQGKKIAVTFSFREEKTILKNLYLNDYLDPDRYFKSFLKVDNSDSALLSVLYRDADAAFIPSYNQVYKENSKAGKIRQIYKTGPMMNGIFAVNTQSLSAPSLKLIRDSLTKMHLQPKGKQLLSKSRMDEWTVIDLTEILDHTTRAEKHPWSQPETAMEPCYLQPLVGFPESSPAFPEPGPLFIAPDIEPQPVF